MLYNGCFCSLLCDHVFRTAHFSYPYRQCQRLDGHCRELLHYIARRSQRICVKILVLPRFKQQQHQSAKNPLQHPPLYYSSQPEAQVFNDFGKTMKEFPLLKTCDANIRHLKLQFVKANPNKKCKTVYLNFHHIRSNVSISEIRKNSEDAELLSKLNMHLMVHLCKEDETQITNLGFYVNFDPSNITKEHIEEHIRMKISLCTRHDKKNIPKFHCSFSSPFVIEEGGTRTSTKAYDLQCKQSDAKDLITLLQETYKTDPNSSSTKFDITTSLLTKIQFINQLIPGQKPHCPD